MNHPHAPSIRSVVAVWVSLLVLTLAEVAMATAGARGAVMLALLLGLSAVKAALILGWFMHLRFERRSLALALIPAAVVAILLLCFIFPDSRRLERMRDGAGREASDVAPAPH